MSAEALTDVVDCSGDTDKGSNCDKELGKCHDCPMQPVLHGSAHQAKTDGHENEVGEPERVQPVLGFPDAFVASCEPQW